MKKKEQIAELEQKVEALLKGISFLSLKLDKLSVAHELLERTVGVLSEKELIRLSDKSKLESVDGSR